MLLKVLPGQLLLLLILRKQVPLQLGYHEAVPASVLHLQRGLQQVLTQVVEVFRIVGHRMRPVLPKRCVQSDYRSKIEVTVAPGQSV
eukprot:Skav215777  [mRNA]  locus=scaffold2278:141803:144085:- [translate_table: standard]